LRLQPGIGIASGKVFSGIIGSLRKKEFTSVGKAVNIASRLQGLARGKEILIDEYTMERVGHEIQATPLPAVSVRGLDSPIPIFSIKVG